MSVAFRTSAFVLLWSSGAIVSEIGLRHGSPFALLIIRYAIALTVLGAFGAWKGTLLPERGSRLRNSVIGLLIAGMYSVCYLLALDHGVTPGALATILGVQPILTIFFSERRVTAQRIVGLCCALGGLSLIVSDGLTSLRFDALGLAFAGMALIGITAGSILQKREKQAPWQVLPMQYAAGLAFAITLSPLGAFRASWDLGFVVPVLWLALIISIGTTFLLYLLIARGNLVNVTSLFYLVPGVTAMMDWAILGDPISRLMIAGLGLVIIGLLLVFRNRPENPVVDAGSRTRPAG